MRGDGLSGSGLIGSTATARPGIRAHHKATEPGEQLP